MDDPRKLCLDGSSVEKHENGFVLTERESLIRGRMDPTLSFANACIELGHQLAKEGKHIAEVKIRRFWNPFEGVHQTAVAVKIEYKLVKK